MRISRKYVPLSRTEFKAGNKSGGEKENEIVVVRVEEYAMATFSVFQHSAKDLKEKKREDDSIYISAHSREDYDCGYRVIGSL
jgi:hypothetical protein